MSWIGYLVCYAYLFAVIFGVGLLKKVFNFSIETSRKIIHTLIVFTWVFLYRFFWPHWQVLIVPISFIIINALSYRFHLFKMIERSNEEDNHKGTIYFAIGITALMVFALIWPQTIMATGLATFALCFGDGPAALIGTHAKNKINIRHDKTLQGTIACFLGALIGLYIFSAIMPYTLPLWVAAILSISTALLELVGKGLDNFSILFGVYLIASILTMNGVIA